MRVFSGIQPTGKIHIGNYLGAIKQWLKYQDNAETIFCIVDLHSLTIPYQPKELKELVKDKIITYLAAGIDPKKSIIFIQSEVKEHSELNWLLSTITPLGDLQRMTQFKEKAKKFSKNINAGLLNYPILMASDILLYDTDVVPVGKDQAQHIEITRRIAKKFNKTFGNVFKIPEAAIQRQEAKIMSLTNPEKKMSKSDPEETRINVFDSPKIIKEKIMAAQTDSGKDIFFDRDKKPGISNLLVIYSAFSGKTIKEVEIIFSGKTYKQFKEELSNLIIKKLEPLRRRKLELETKNDYINEIARMGQEKAKIIASKKMEMVKKVMGLNYY